MYEEEIKRHDLSCWCESCFWRKMENPEIMEGYIDEYRQYAHEVFAEEKALRDNIKMV